VNRERHRELIPYVVAVIATVEMFFLFLMVIHNNPFTTYLTELPTDGRGLNPLLQNFYMAIHPPTMYLGFVGLTIPFAFGMAALFTGHLDDSWLRAVRRWTMFSWFFLSLGLTLGMIWAYEELGWGGYWGWDPVENAGMLPWFTADRIPAFGDGPGTPRHVARLERHLVIITFLLTIVGTFLTRSGVVQSIHAFGEDPELARYFVIFMVSTIVFCFGWVIYRLPLLKARHELDSWVSKERRSSRTTGSCCSRRCSCCLRRCFRRSPKPINGERLTVGPPFFNRWMVPIGLILLLLTASARCWRGVSRRRNLREQFMWPVLSGLVAGGVWWLSACASGARAFASRCRRLLPVR
jgi:cytochrome c-type biogenesis protein CcmF